MSRILASLPLVFAGILFCALGVLSYLQLRTWTGFPLAAGAVLVGCYVLWLLLESHVVAKEEIGKNRSRLDKGTMELYALARGGMVFSALGLPGNFQIPLLLRILGLILFVLGVGIRLSAIRTLGKWYSHRVRFSTDHQIITQGPYRLVRHPAYLGMFTAHLGFGLFFFNWIALGVLLGFLLPAIIIRIFVEEKAMMGSEAYVDYARKKRRLFPVIW